MHVSTLAAFISITLALVSAAPAQIAERQVGNYGQYYAVFKGYDANQGADIKSPDSASSWQDCQDACGREEKCRTATFVASTKSCYLSSTIAIGSAGPSQDVTFGVTRWVANSPSDACADFASEIQTNNYKADLTALCKTNGPRGSFALYSNCDQRVGNFEAVHTGSAEVCAAQCGSQALQLYYGQGCIGFTYLEANGYCYKNRVNSLSAAGQNSGTTMGYTGTCASTRGFVPTSCGTCVDYYGD